MFVRPGKIAMCHGSPVRFGAASANNGGHIHKQCGVYAVSPSKFYCYSDVDFTTRKQVLKLRSHPWIPSDVIIRAFVFDLETGGMKEVTPNEDK